MTALSVTFAAPGMCFVADVKVYLRDVTAHLRDGTSQHVFVDRVPGRNDALYTPAQHRVKLDELSVDVIGAKWSARLFAMVDGLDPGTSVAALTTLLRSQWKPKTTRKETAMKTLLRILTASVALGSAASAAVAQQAAVPPTIRVIVPFAPGAGTDVLARAVANQLGPRLGTTVIVENRAGASGSIAVAAVAKGPKDGSMLLFHSMSLITTAATAKTSVVDVTTDLMPVALVADGPMLIGLSASSGIRTPAELVARARAKPDTLTAGSGGIGSVGHLAAELLNDAAKVQIRHIPYKGAAPALTDVAAGTVDMLIASYSTIGPQIRSGRVIPIAVTSSQPSAAYPGVPPMASAAPGYNTGIWYGMFAPAGVPAPLLKRLNAEIIEIARSGEVQALVQADGATPVLLGPDELAQRIRQDFATWKKLATDKQIVVE